LKHVDSESALIRRIISYLHLSYDINVAIESYTGTCFRILPQFIEVSKIGFYQCLQVDWTQ